VKLLAGVGAWVGPMLVLQAFVASAIVGGVMAAAMVAWSGEYVRHWAMFHTIGNEILTIRKPRQTLRDCRGSKAENEAPPIRDSNRCRHDCLLRLDGLVPCSLTRDPRRKGEHRER